MKATELKPGMAITVDGKLYVCVKTDHTKPGKGPAYIQAKMRAIDGSGVAERRFGSSDTIDAVTLDRRTMEYLYSDGTGAVFMDQDDFDQNTIPVEILGDSLLYLKPNGTCTVLHHDGNPVSVELPASVELEVVDTPPGIKGATVTNQLKEAELETGLKTRVPPFIVNGETVKVSTEDGSYISRGKES